MGGRGPRKPLPASPFFLVLAGKARPRRQGPGGPPFFSRAVPAPPGGGPPFSGKSSAVALARGGGPGFSPGCPPPKVPGNAPGKMAPPKIRAFYR